MSPHAMQPVGLVPGWCSGRCRTFLEYGLFTRRLANGRIRSCSSRSTIHASVAGSNMAVSDLGPGLATRWGDIWDHAHVDKTGESIGSHWPRGHHSVLHSQLSEMLMQSARFHARRALCRCRLKTQTSLSSDPFTVEIYASASW